MRARFMIAASLLAACGDKAPSIALDQLFAETVRARCDRLVRCGLLASADTCDAYFRAPDEAALHAAIAAGKIRYDGASALRCMDALAALSCDETSREVRVPTDACDRMLRGTLAVGAACSFDRECSSGSCDASCPTDSCCTGKCLATHTAAAGAPCTSDDDCVAETFCGSASPRTCTPLSGRGQPCRTDAHCDYGFACIGASDLDDGACRAMPLIGDSCPYLRCAELGALCDSTQHCVPVGLPGAPCTTGADCSPFLRCGADGRCIDTPVLGEPCTVDCAGEAWCNQGRCVAPQENLAPCTSDNQCASQFCQEGAAFDQCADRPVCF